MNRPTYNPPLLNGGWVHPLLIFSTADLVNFTRDAGLTLKPNTDLAAAVSALDRAFGDFACGERHEGQSASPAENRDWLAEIARLCRALFVAVGAGKEGIGGLDARFALRAPESSSPDYQRFAQLVTDASPSGNNGNSQNWELKEFDEPGVTSRYRFLLEMALPATLQAIAVAADAERARLSPAIRKGRPPVPNLNRRFLFAELGQVYTEIHDLGASRRRGAPGKVGWHRAVIALAGERVSGDEAFSVQGLAAWARGDRQGKSISTNQGDEVKKAISAAAHD